MLLFSYLEPHDDPENVQMVFMLFLGSALLEFRVDIVDKRLVDQLEVGCHDAVEELFEVSPVRMLNSGWYFDYGGRKLVPDSVTCPDFFSLELLDRSNPLIPLLFMSLFLHYSNYYLKYSQTAVSLLHPYLDI